MIEPTEDLEPYPWGYQCAVWVVLRMKLVDSEQKLYPGIEHFEKLKETWEESPLCAKLIEELVNKAPGLREIYKVACFELGPLTDDRSFL